MERPMGINSRRLEDVPELIHLIQLLLPEKEAARTSILSKSWLKAWSTIPTLRFLVTKDEERSHLNVIDRTLARYLRDNIPIKWLDLTIAIENRELASLAECIRPMAIKSCLRKLSLEIKVRDDHDSKMPDDILYAKNLDILRISCSFLVSITSRHVINCVSLRELELDHVYISDEVLDYIFSTCTLLEIIKLTHCKGFKTIKIKDLGSLYQLEIVSDHKFYSVSGNLEINHVPQLRLLSWDICFNALPAITLPFNMVTQLRLGFMIENYGFLDMIKTKFPFLNSLILILNMRSWTLHGFSITCASLKRLSLLSCLSTLTRVQVNETQKLDYFCFQGKTMPRFVSPAVVGEIKLALSLSNPIRTSFFKNLWRAIRLSIKCDIAITTTQNPQLDFSLGDLSKNVECPAMNVQQLSFKTIGDDGTWKLSQFFEAMFVICYPKHVVAYPDLDTRFKENNCFCKLMVEVMEKKTIWHWPYYLEGFETKTEEGETLLPDYLKSYRDGSAPAICVVFKLNWR